MRRRCRRALRSSSSPPSSCYSSAPWRARPSCFASAPRRQPSLPARSSMCGCCRSLSSRKVGTRFPPARSWRSRSPSWSRTSGRAARTTARSVPPPDNPRVDPITLAIHATPAFVASAVEFVEATTIVLAVGVTRGWRAPLVGAALATITLAFLVLTLGATLVAVVPEHALKLLVGALLLLFGLRWLRKAILRFAGIVALHDEELIYQREIAALRSEGSRPRAFDRVGALVAYKAVLLEGTEVAFIVIAFGAGGGSALTSAIVGAAGAGLG